MDRAQPLRKTLWIILAAWAGTAGGCTHNYYYTNPNCLPAGEAVTTHVGSVCDVPNGQVVAGSAPQDGVIVQAPARRTVQPAPASGPSRIVISQPGYASQAGRGANRIGWRRPDPESNAITRVEGALDPGTVQR